MEYRQRFAGRKIGLVVCGGNIDSRLLASVLMRGLVRAGRMVRLRVTISDQTGSLAPVAREIGETGGNLLESYHQRLFSPVPVQLAELYAVVDTHCCGPVRRSIAPPH